jgi:hypothetical protein
MFHLQNFTIVKKTKAVDYEQMPTEELEQMLCDYQNEKRTHEARIEWLTNECDELQAIIDGRVDDATLDE